MESQTRRSFSPSWYFGIRSRAPHLQIPSPAPDRLPGAALAVLENGHDGVVLRMELAPADRPVRHHVGTQPLQSPWLGDGVAYRPCVRDCCGGWDSRVSRGEEGEKSRGCGGVRGG